MIPNIVDKVFVLASYHFLCDLYILAKKIHIFDKSQKVSLFFTIYISDNNSNTLTQFMK